MRAIIKWTENRPDGPMPSGVRRHVETADDEEMTSGQPEATTMEIEEFELEASQDGKFVIFTAGQANQEPISLNIPCDAIGQMVVGLLGASTACAQLDNSTPRGFSGVGDQSEGAFALANGIALQDVTDRPDVVALTFLFGQTQVAVGLSRVALQPLGSALLAASADTSKPQ